VRAGDESFERLRVAIEELAAGETAELLAQARAEARSRVRGMLTEAIAQAMLERAHEELASEQRRDGAPRRPDRPTQRPADALQQRPAADALQQRPAADAPPQPSAADAPPQPSAADGPPPPPAPGAGDLGWYVYCITRADGGALPDLSGVDPDHGAMPLREGELTAIVSRVGLSDFDEQSLREHLGDMEWLERTARRHEEVLDAVRSVRTVIPMRLVTVYRDEVGVRAMLDREAGVLIEALTDLEDKAEWGVKVFASGGEAELEVDGHPAAAGSSAGTAYIEGRRREHDRRRRTRSRHDAACASIHERLSAVAVDALLSAPQRPEISERDGEMVLNGVYLVEDGRRGRFHAEISALQAEYEPFGLELEPTGPWPAYNFVPQTIGAAR
jgi:hypothetical protein